MYQNLRNRTMESQQPENLIITSNNILALKEFLTLEQASERLKIPKDLVRQIWESNDNTLLLRYVEENTLGNHLR
ncbi:hypothetical protein [Candidatus Epulonipiscium viviparus]|uniref:hypothetical protein n=1 Tax=Candidatus Epulonipiscium viviparus TaxID=420336 RepID=UPI00049723FF|nr:hypothetical protein [Candidatus Epulopiscium viviparus]